jgi:hypothetical protein
MDWFAGDLVITYMNGAKETFYDLSFKAATTKAAMLDPKVNGGIFMVIYNPYPTMVEYPK